MTVRGNKSHISDRGCISRSLAFLSIIIGVESIEVKIVMPFAIDGGQAWTHKVIIWDAVESEF